MSAGAGRWASFQASTTGRGAGLVRSVITAGSSSDQRRSRGPQYLAVDGAFDTRAAQYHNESPEPRVGLDTTATAHGRTKAHIVHK